MFFFFAHFYSVVLNSCLKKLVLWFSFLQLLWYCFYHLLVLNTTVYRVLIIDWCITDINYFYWFITSHYLLNKLIYKHISVPFMVVLQSVIKTTTTVVVSIRYMLLKEGSAQPSFVKTFCLHVRVLRKKTHRKSFFRKLMTKL